MTIIITVEAGGGIWQCSDRALSDVRGRRVAANAVKAFALEAANSKALIGYAGIGAVRGGRQISEWLKQIYVDRTWDIENAIEHLRQVSQRRLDPYRIYSQHEFSIGVVQGTQAAIYSLSNRNSPCFTKQHHDELHICGSGFEYIAKHELIQLRRLIGKRFENPSEIAQILHHVIKTVSKRTNTVSETAICTFRHGSKGGWTRQLGFAEDNFMIPTIGGGKPVDDIMKIFIEVAMPAFQKSKVEGRPPKIDFDEMTRQLARIKFTPGDAL